MKPRKPMTECRKCPHRKHARACRTCGCAYLSKAAKPLPHRNPKRRPAAAASAQREQVLERDGNRCAFEVLVGEGAILPGRRFVLRGGDIEFITTEDDGTVWMRCQDPAPLFTCHVIRRHQCGDAALDADVAIAGCKRCHDAFDHRTHPSTWDSVRVPEAALARAIAAVRKCEAERAERGLAVVPLPGAHE